jgi:hypothetical protein
LTRGKVWPGLWFNIRTTPRQRPAQKGNPMITLFGLYLNAYAITMMKTEFGDCYIWQGTREANVIIQDASCDEVADEIRRQLKEINKK